VTVYHSFLKLLTRSNPQRKHCFFKCLWCTFTYFFLLTYH